MTKLKILVLVLAMVTPMRSFSAAPGAGFGVGAFPLSPTTVSMWLLRTDSTAQPLPMLIVYFIGSPGWHNQKWESKFEGNIKNESRTDYRLVSKDITLEIAISEDKKTIWIQGKEYKLEESNVYVVNGADQKSAITEIKALGSFELPFSREQPLAVLFLNQHSELAEELK